MNTQSRMGVPPRRKDVFFVRSPKPLEAWKFTVYSNEIQPIYTHFNGKTTVPCYENHDLCEPSHSILNLRWKGYLFGWDHDMNRLSFLQLTHEAANQLVDQLDGPQPLRGLNLHVTRTKKKNGRMNVRVETMFGNADLTRAPAAPPVRRSLFNLFQLPYNDFPFTTSLEEEQTAPAVLPMG